MKTKLANAVLTIGAILGLTTFVVPSVVQAAPVDVFQSCNTAGVNSPVCSDRNGQRLFGPNSIWTRVLNVMIFLVGAAATIMIVVGGLRYVLSGGDSNAVNGAKNTILYAVVGIIVAVLSYAIVNFVLTKV